MIPEEFIKAYEIALATQNWKNIEPLISESISVIFSDGTVHCGKNKVQIAYENNFSKIKNEKYLIDNVRWLSREENFAVYLFDFYWTGVVNGKSVSGNGIGTSVLIKEDCSWKLLTEHLGRKSN
ncbi:nuclear transport factor 2 family protein [Flagellimonas allohymeniacidonis]|uniref:Nuclear transport factor 2 family protein n=1 Tax=Flagellimonas allohymeniacidonis TaxID=2517819 RepID=A0A4Q8QHC1_9FLAO|nr:nuclear transport factor 2 family protein [Allomuricauda hymeniacidonis]TAI47829.1 nuclear transport factor 2 family protein [Allomuricauda hymeniacidonis]